MSHIVYLINDKSVKKVNIGIPTRVYIMRYKKHEYGSQDNNRWMMMMKPSFSSIFSLSHSRG